MLAGRGAHAAMLMPAGVAIALHSRNPRRDNYGLQDAGQYTGVRLRLPQQNV